ncbi:hypothetical protein FH972_021568 [Carpinus fangiana]|uniref:DUF3455 domain-containing protein n=1 Tax=Carpinus fangiana TaxID=176857 RepID=A0A5N6KQ24_9ROSI|nr:hypothetical protein FH972_021568 [Carpinus fangiana]
MNSMLKLLAFAVAVAALPACQSPAPPNLPKSTLPPPPKKDLRIVALGLGTQNYTCGAETEAPKSVGAVAQLYDVTALVSIPIFGDWEAEYLTCNANHANTNYGQRKIGVHYFDAEGTPTFDLTTGTRSVEHRGGLFLSAAKKASADAPDKACPGRNGAPAVPWLLLEDKKNGKTRGLSQVYRVNTVGGTAPETCRGQKKSFTVDYAAEYWFYT